LKELGFDGPYSGGKHPYMIKGDLVLTLPNPHKKEVSVDLLSRILKQADIKKEEWLK
jgi:predicted RNA binding protein YcfA (HicA-like mRNA interferase family)